MSKNGKLLSQREMNEKGLAIHFLDYAKLNYRVKILIQEKENIHLTGPHLPRILFEIGIGNKGCNRSYNKLMSYNTNIVSTVKEKWEETLNEEIPLNIIEKAFKNLSTMEENAYQK